MAEFDGEAASLGLFQEFLSHLSAKSADEEDEDVPGTGGWKNGFGGKSRVDQTVKQRSFGKTFIQSSLIHDKNDNGVSPQEEHVNNNNTADLVVEVDDDDDENRNVKKQNSVQLRDDDVNKRTLAVAQATESDVAEGGSDIGDEFGICDNIADVNVHINLNGTASTVEISYHKQKKGVNFPTDTIISGYLEPPDPWKNACSWTTNELVSAYKKSCEVYGAKPLTKLIQQLQTFSPANSREEVLSLKGEKLDQKQCECLEEVLRRVRFKLLDFEASHLDDESAVTLFDMIEFYESGYQLNIAFNKSIQARGWQACSRLVRRTPELNYLDLRNCDLNERTIPIFGRALKLGCHLTILHMESMNLSGRPLIILVAALKMNETLQELFLADNKLLPTDGIQLGNLLHYNHKLALLDLRNNHLQDVGTSHICEGLTEQNKGSGLRTLVLWNNSINYQAMSVLGRALACSQNMQTLNIGHNAITNEGVHLLKDGLIRVSSLLRLGLQGTRISDEGAVALAEYIAESMVLLRIDLRDNDIKTGGLMALSHAMRVNTSVTRIDLDKDPKKDPGIKDYVEQQSRLLRDILTFQQRNIQLALQKEEEEKSRLEEKAVTELATAKKTVEDEQQVGNLPANSSTESFTLIDEVLAEEEETAHQKAEESNTVIAGKENKEDNAADRTPNDTDQLDSSPYKEGGKIQQRPTVLFPRRMLPPQATLDSPLPSSGFNNIISDATADAEPCSEATFPVLPMSPAPAEIILSPQYFPRQIARKIFSVSRVREGASSQQLSSSPTSSVAFDPLCVSPLQLIPVSSTPILMPPTLPVLQCVDRVSQHSKVNLLTDSPSASLFQHLADETVKQMISPDIDVDVNHLFSKDAESDSLTKDIDDTRDGEELIEDFPVGNSPLSAPWKSFGAELADLLQAERSREVLPEPNGDIDANDNVDKFNDATDTKEVISSTDSNKENMVTTCSSVNEQESFVSEDSSRKLLTVDRITKDIQNPSSAAFTSQEFDLSQACTDGNGDPVLGNNCETHIENVHTLFDPSIEDALRDERKANSHEDHLLEAEHPSVDPEQLSAPANTSAIVLVDISQDKDMKLMDIKNSTIVKDQTGHLQNHVPSVESAVADMNVQEELMAVHLNNFSSPSLQSSENIEELLSPVLPHPYLTNQSVVGKSEEILSLKNLQKLGTDGKNTPTSPPVAFTKTLSDWLTDDSLDDQVSADSVVSDNVDTINVNSVVLDNGDIVNVDNVVRNNVDIVNVEAVVGDKVDIVNVEAVVCDKVNIANVEAVVCDNVDTVNVEAVVCDKVNIANVDSIVGDNVDIVNVDSVVRDNVDTVNVDPVVGDKVDIVNDDSVVSDNVDIVNVDSVVGDNVDVVSADNVVSDNVDTINVNNVVRDNIDINVDSASGDNVDIVNADSVVGDNVDIVNVDFGMDEEPWLTVGVDPEASDSEASRKSSKQPDFFTTLSMNGLAQELASALTSFDGSSGPFEVDEYSTGS